TLPDRILFVPSSPELTAESKPHLDSLIQYLRAENIQLSVLTHVNSTDDPLLDIWLAKRRTLTVIRYLAAQGIEQGRLRPLEPPLSSAAQEVNPDQESGQVELNVVIRQRG
nr:hypothetical protein [Gammaproteobacteria bacterium]